MVRRHLAALALLVTVTSVGCHHRACVRCHRQQMRHAYAAGCGCATPAPVASCDTCSTASYASPVATTPIHVSAPPAPAPAAVAPAAEPSISVPAAAPLPAGPPVPVLTSQRRGPLLPMPARW